MDEQILNLIIERQQDSAQTIINMWELMSANISSLRKRQRRHAINLRLLHRRQTMLLNQLLKNHRRKINVMKRTCSNFWEYTVLKNDDNFFKEHFRITRENFNLLCEKLKHMKRLDTNYRKAITLEKRIAIALYSLGSSAKYKSIANIFGVGKSTVCSIVKNFCREVWDILQPRHLNFFPLNEETIKECVSGFESMGFPQCLGAIDACHIEVKTKAADAEDCCNSNGWYSTVLLALVDYKNKFLYINVGNPGSCNDSDIFENSLLKKYLESPIMKDMSRKINDINVPIVIIGDSSFRLSNVLMKPFPIQNNLTEMEKNYNHVHLKCRKVVEDTFEQLKARFRRIGKGLYYSMDNTSGMIKCCCVLHNFLNEHNDMVNNAWIENLREFEETRGRQQPEKIICEFSLTGEKIRDVICKHIGGANEGVVKTEPVDDSDDPGISAHVTESTEFHDVTDTSEIH